MFTVYGLRFFVSDSYSGSDAEKVSGEVAEELLKFGGQAEGGAIDAVVALVVEFDGADVVPLSLTLVGGREGMVELDVKFDNMTRLKNMAVTTPKIPGHTTAIGEILGIDGKDSALLGGVFGCHLTVLGFNCVVLLVAGDEGNAADGHHGCESHRIELE